MEGPQDDPAAVQQCDQLPARQVGQGRDRFEIGVGAVEQVARPVAAARNAAGRPATRPAADGRPGSGSACGATFRFGLISPASRRSMATCPSTQTTTSLASTSAWVAAPGQDHGLAHGFPKRGDPEVVLQLGERRRERLRDRTRTVDRTAGHAPDLGGDRARLEQPQLLVVGDGPLDVLRAAEDRGDLRRTAPRAGGGRPSPSRGPSLASNSRTFTLDASSTYLEPSTSPLTSGSGPPRTAVTTLRSVRPDTGSIPNITPPNRGSISGWTRTAIGWSAAPARCRESSTGVTAATNASKPLMPMTDSNWPAIDDVGRVLDDRGAAGHERPSSPPARSKASRTAGCCATSAPPSTASQNAVVRTTPGSVARPAAAPRARAAALPPVSAGSTAASSPRSTTKGRSCLHGARWRARCSPERLAPVHGIPSTHRSRELCRG